MSYGKQALLDQLEAEALRENPGARIVRFSASEVTTEHGPPLKGSVEACADIVWPLQEFFRKDE